MDAKSLSFDSFDQMAKYILTRTMESAFPRLHFLISVILVLPFVTADCERFFSKLGYIKTTDRNRLGEILNELLLIYDANPSEKKLIDIRKLAEKLAGKWSKDKTDKTPWSHAYDMCIV